MNRQVDDKAVDLFWKLEHMIMEGTTCLLYANDSGKPGVISSVKSEVLKNRNRRL